MAHEASRSPASEEVPHRLSLSWTYVLILHLFRKQQRHLKENAIMLLYGRNLYWNVRGMALSCWIHHLLGMVSHRRGSHEAWVPIANFDVKLGCDQHPEMSAEDRTCWFSWCSPFPSSCCSSLEFVCFIQWCGSVPHIHSAVRNSYTGCHE